MLDSMIKNEDKLKEMLSLQNAFNAATNGPDWNVTGVSKEGKEIDWFLCINMESGEAIDSTPYKHWKSIENEVNWANINIELTDIWHFILSQVIVSGYSLDSLLDKVKDHINLNGLEIHNYKHLNNVLRNIQFISNASMDNVGLFMKDPYSKEDLESYKLYVVISEFIRACYVANLPFDELYSLYIMKNCLNGFRQTNGYKEDTYIKNWIGMDGKTYEDNVMCQEIWESLENQNYNNLMNELQKYYDDMVLRLS